MESTSQIYKRNKDFPFLQEHRYREIFALSASSTKTILHYTKFAICHTNSTPAHKEGDKETTVYLNDCK